MKPIKYFIAIIVLILFGCASPPNIDINTPEMPENEISINKIELRNQSRNSNLNTRSFIHSNVIRKIEFVPRENNGKNRYFDLKIYLNKPGRLLWMKLSFDYKDKPVAFLVDGFFYRSFIPQPIMDKNKGSACTLIQGPFDEGTAKKLKKWAPNNFAFYNQDPAPEDLRNEKTKTYAISN